jgi:predicted MFS family arabinose efflux permease
VATAVTRAFDRNAGLPVGVATAGATAGQFFILPLLAAVLTALSWRWSFAGLALGCLVLTPFAWFLSGSVDRGSTPRDGGPAITLGADLRFLVTSPTFHVLFWSFFVCGYTTSGVIENHFLPYASYCGFAPLVGASAYGVLSVLNFAGMITSGWLTDRMNRPLLLGSIYIIRAMTFLLLINVGTDVDMLFVFAVAFGIVDFATIPVTASLAASHLGLRVMGLAMGLIVGGHQIGGALGAFLGGLLFDLYANYAWLWWSSIGVAIVGGLLVYTMSNTPPAARPMPA